MQHPSRNLELSAIASTSENPNARGRDGQREKMQVTLQTSVRYCGVRVQAELKVVVVCCIPLCLPVLWFLHLLQIQNASSWSVEISLPARNQSLWDGWNGFLEHFLLLSIVGLPNGFVHADEMQTRV